MTPKEKAQQLYNKYYRIPLYIKTVKQCCIIAVDEIMKLDALSNLPLTMEYWAEVKKEIEKL